MATVEQRISDLEDRVKKLEGGVSILDGATSSPNPASAPGPTSEWLKPPYYLAPPDVLVNAISFSGISAGPIPAIETYLAKGLQSQFSDAGGFLNGSKQVNTPAELVAGYVETAQERARQYPSLADGMTPAEIIMLGVKYGQMAVELLKKIPASIADGPALPGSLYDAWVAKNA